MFNKKSALFVCLGNTCRSPIAEAVFLHQIALNGTANKWEVDSAGIQDWHKGNLPNPRARHILDTHNVPYNTRARQINNDDFNKFDYIFGMDEHNIADLKKRSPKGCHPKILLLGDFDPEGDRIIWDPYCDYGTEGFEKCFQQCTRSCKAFLKSNICRSPIAEAVFLYQLTQNGTSDNWEVDSAGIGGWHAGNLPDQRARSTLQNHSVPYDNKARQIKKEDYNKYDYIFGMDHDNIDDLKSRAPKGSKAKILLLGSFDPERDEVIRDPYYDSGSEGFEKCFQQCMRCCKAFLDGL